MIHVDLSSGGPSGSRLLVDPGPVLRALFEQAVVGVLVCRVGWTGSKVVGANATAASLLGRDADDLLGHVWRLPLGPADRARLDGGLRDALDGAGSGHLLDLVLPGDRTTRATLGAVPSIDLVLVQVTPPHA